MADAEPRLSQRILIVDDDQDILELLTTLLQSQHYEVDPAADGEEAIALIQEQRAAPYAVLITDIMMPSQTGLDVIDRLRQLNLPTVPIAITGAGEGIYEEALRERGIARVLYKPYEFADLLNLVREAIDQSCEPEACNHSAV